jgi:protein-tyrosine sulfotransferase
VNQSPIIILGCTKSGTSLMRNLFDGHPEVFSVPTESHFFQLTGSWVYYYFSRTKPQKLTFEEMKEKLTEWINFCNYKVNHIGDGFTSGKWDMAAFKKTLSSPVHSLKELSDLYIESMFNALHNKGYPGLRFVEKSVENTEFALEWLQLYPDAKFIHIVRNPYSNLVAIRKFLDKPRFPFLNRALFSMYSSYYFLYKNQLHIDQSKYKVVLYEELINNPRATMNDIAAFTSIGYNDILLQPTLLNNNWSGNSTTKKSFSEISNSQLDKWKNDITRYEVKIVNELFSHVLNDYNFEIMNPKDCKPSFLPKEGFINYFMNKVSYYYLPKKRIHKIT